MLTSLKDLIAPELILSAVACVLFLLGCSNKPSARRLAPWLALLALVAVLIFELAGGVPVGIAKYDVYGAVRITPFTHYVETLSAAVGILFVLLSWPTNPDVTGNSALYFGQESGEYFALLLLSIVGIFFAASADNLILLFLAIELASIPTYIMVSISRTQPVAQEAGVKYFFLGTMAAAVMLFGFSYLYGTTGTIQLSEIQDLLASQHGALTAWELLAVVMLIVGFAFKMAVVPLHFYAGDVYQGAATPVTALLSYVPKTTGFVALLKVLLVIGGPDWDHFILPHQINKMLWILAVLTMTTGNVLGLWQHNVKRMLAYSSVAHSGYMLAAVATISYAKGSAVQAVLFYLAAYGIMNAGTFGVLMLLPARDHRDGGSAETLHDLSGTGRQHPGLGLAMAVCCFSLIGIPMTVGFVGKFYILLPALRNQFYWLSAITMVNAAISAGYYLKIVGTMFLTPEPHSEHPITTSNVPSPGHALVYPLPIALAIIVSAGGALLLGGVLMPVTNRLSNHAQQASERIASPSVAAHSPAFAPTAAATVLAVKSHLN